MNTNEEIIAKLKHAGVTCRSCWWQEGGRCYAEPCERVPHPQGWGSMSTKIADEVCEKHSNKRAVLARVIPNDMLIIGSEERAKQQGKTPPNY